MMVGSREFKDEYLYLTTIGRNSGKPHEIEIWYVKHGLCYYLIAEHREQAHWVKNIQRNQDISFRVHGEIFKGTGRSVDAINETKLVRLVAGLMQAKYQWSDGLVVELCPE